MVQPSQDVADLFAHRIGRERHGPAAPPVRAQGQAQHAQFAPQPFGQHGRARRGQAGQQGGEVRTVDAYEHRAGAGLLLNGFAQLRAGQAQPLIGRLAFHLAVDLRHVALPENQQMAIDAAVALHRAPQAFVEELAVRQPRDRVVVRLVLQRVDAGALLPQLVMDALVRLDQGRAQRLQFARQAFGQFRIDAGLSDMGKVVGQPFQRTALQPVVQARHIAVPDQQAGDDQHQLRHAFGEEGGFQDGDDRVVDGDRADIGSVGRAEGARGHDLRGAALLQRAVGARRRLAELARLDHPPGVVLLYAHQCIAAMPLQVGRQGLPLRGRRMRLRQHPGQRSSRCFDMALLAFHRRPVVRRQPGSLGADDQQARQQDDAEEKPPGNGHDEGRLGDGRHGFV